LFVLGSIAFAVVVLTAWRARRSPLAALAAAIIMVAILTRAAILALIDATAFPTHAYHYVLPGIPLLLMFSFLSFSALAARTPLRFRNAGWAKPGHATLSEPDPRRSRK
jgi:hypothetical protein